MIMLLSPVYRARRGHVSWEGNRIPEYQEAVDVAFTKATEKFEEESSIELFLEPGKIKKDKRKRDCCWV